GGRRRERHPFDAVPHCISPHRYGASGSGPVQEGVGATRAQAGVSLSIQFVSGASGLATGSGFAYATTASTGHDGPKRTRSASSPAPVVRGDPRRLPTLREAGLENANRETDACGSPDTAIRSDRFRDATSSCPPTGRSALDRRFPARVP